MFKHDKALLHEVKVDGPNLLNREEAHNTMFREAFNRIQDTGSLKDWGITKDSKLYFNLSTPGGQYFNANNPQPPSFNAPNASGTKM